MRENDLLQHVYAANAELPRSVVIPPGDDMGGFTLPGTDRTVLVTVDQVADGVHVDVATTPLSKIGRKAITRNLSDVAAMAAVPLGAVAAVSLPRSFAPADATTLFDAMRSTAAAFDCPLMGGDISIWDGRLLISVTLFAHPAGIDPVLRTGSRPGDAIYVTGHLGYSLAGHHLDFTPRLALARRLAGDPATRPRAMIDLSDGIAQDLPRLVDHAEIDAHLLPIRDVATTDDRPPWHHALGDGEDYELLFTAPPPPGISMPHMIDGVPITRIGTVTARGGLIVIPPTPPLRPGEAAGIPALGSSQSNRIDLRALATGWEHHT